MSRRRFQPNWQTAERLVPRFVYVTIRLLPFVFSFIRDWRGYVFFGQPRRLSEKEHHRRARDVRKLCANLGPSFIKGAQLLAMREDIVPFVYTEELKQLQDRVPPFPIQEVYREIEESLGRKVPEIFESFDPNPIAAASLGQVHRARYHGRLVAVKVLRPGVEKLITKDLHAVFFLFFLIDIFVENNLIRSFRVIIEEYRRMIHDEVNFRVEMHNAQRLRHILRHDSRVRIPRCYAELTTNRTVVFEYVKGSRVDHTEELKAKGMTWQELVNLLIETYVGMTVRDGFVHADPHPGNLVIDQKNRLVIFDYGMTVEFDEETRTELLKIVYAVVKRDVDAIVDSFYTLGMVDPDINRAVLVDAAQTLLDIQLTQDVTTRQVQEIVEDILQTFYKFPLRMPNQLVYLFRAAALVEGIALSYNPRFNAIRYATPIVKKLLREIDFQGTKTGRELVVDEIKDAFQAGRELIRIIHRLEREQLQVKVNRADLYEIEGFLNSFLRRMLTGFAMCALALVAGLVYFRSGSFLLLLLGLSFASIIFLAVAYLPIRPGSSRFR